MSAPNVEVTNILPSDIQFTESFQIKVQLSNDMCFCHDAISVGLGETPLQEDGLMCQTCRSGVIACVRDVTCYVANNTAHLVDFVLSDDVIEQNPQSAQQVDYLHWTQLVDRDVSWTVVNL